MRFLKYFRLSLVCVLLVILAYSLLTIYRSFFDLQVFPEHTLIYDLEKSDGKNNSIIRIGDAQYFFFCSGVVISKHYALTAAHCLVDSWGKVEKRDLHIYDIMGNLHSLNVKIAAVDNLRDLALIRGDFTNFESLDVDWYGNCQWDLQKEKLLLCGYPSGEALFCSSAVFTNNTFFQLRARGGPIFQGQSGGPVMAMCRGKPTVIGVNSAVDHSGVIISPVIGSRSRLWQSYGW